MCTIDWDLKMVYYFWFSDFATFKSGMHCFAISDKWQKMQDELLSMTCLRWM